MTTAELTNQEIIENIKKIIAENSGWMEIQQIADKLGVARNKRLFEDSHSSTIGQIIHRFLKKEGFRSKKVEPTEDTYSIWVCAPDVPDEDLEKALEINGNNERYRVKFIKRDTEDKPKAEHKPKQEIDPEAVLACVSEFKEMFGVGGFVKILHGSRAFKDTDYNQQAKTSQFYGMFSDHTQNEIEAVIMNLLDSGKIFKSGNFRPVLTTNKVTTFKPQKPKAEEEEPVIENEDTEALDEIIDLINQGENIFITGYAGTGKSYILNKLKKIFDIDVTSTTGMAAVNVQGQTVHSWAGVGICNKPIEQVVKKIRHRRKIAKQIQDCRILAIDEVSMLDSHTIDYIDTVLRLLREDERAFGGIQVLLFGDFFQLPPVNRRESGFCFKSNAWRDLELKNIVLEKIYRQKDADFIRALNNIRLNSLTQDDARLFQARQMIDDTDKSGILHIFSTNNEADRYNSMKFNSIEAEIHTFKSKDLVYKSENAYIELKKEDSYKTLSAMDKMNWELLDKFCKAPQSLELKVGCKVMLLKNQNFEKGLINGSCGEVKQVNDDSVLIHFDNGEFATIKPQTFEYYKGGEISASREQYPLRLAYGITIHKSQGMTLERVLIDFNRIFECGQAYVALSRVKTLDGMHLKAFNPNKIIVDREVVDFYDSLKN